MCVFRLSSLPASFRVCSPEKVNQLTQDVLTLRHQVMNEEERLARQSDTLHEAIDTLVNNLEYEAQVDAVFSSVWNPAAEEQEIRDLQQRLQAYQVSPQKGTSTRENWSRCDLGCFVARNSCSPRQPSGLSENQFCGV